MPADPLSTTFAALADPTRRTIVSLLAQGQATVGELAAPFDISLPSVSHHLKVLEDAGLVERTRDAQWRVCRLRPEPLREVSAWVDEYRGFWQSTFASLNDYVERARRASEPAPGRRRRRAAGGR
jgi:DNA-binding transcriptional ArsR family regulator